MSNVKSTLLTYYTPLPGLVYLARFQALGMLFVEHEYDELVDPDWQECDRFEPQWAAQNLKMTEKSKAKF